MKWIGCVLAVLVAFTSAMHTPLLNTGCDSSCMLSILESIPENLTYARGSPTHGSTHDGWMELLKIAKKTLDIASYYWTLQGHGNISDITDKQGRDVFDGLSELKSRGVALRIVQNPPSEEYPSLDSKALQDKDLATVHNLNVTKLIGDGILHTKLWVVDGKHFYIGSANMDWRSLTQVKELGLMGTNCECLAQDVQRLFNVYWYLTIPDNSLPPKGKWPQEFAAQYNITNPASITINGSLPSTGFWASSPPQFCASGRTNDINALLDVIAKAEKFVYVAVMDYAPAVVFAHYKYYWARIDDALREAAFRGVNVRLMGSHWSHTPSEMIHFLKSLSDDNGMGYHGTIETRMFIVPPLTTKNVPFTRVNHNKYMVTDNAAYIGTSNWSGDYFISTGGLSCTINSQEGIFLNPRKVSPIQEQLKEIFERDWYSQYATI